MSRFPSAAHLCSWAALCPGQHESAGKRESGRTRHGNPYLRTALIEAASAAARTKGSASRLGIGASGRAAAINVRWSPWLAKL